MIKKLFYNFIEKFFEMQTDRDKKQVNKNKRLTDLNQVLEQKLIDSAKEFQNKIDELGISIKILKVELKQMVDEKNKSIEENKLKNTGTTNGKKAQ